MLLNATISPRDPSPSNPSNLLKIAENPNNLNDEKELGLMAKLLLPGLSLTDPEQSLFEKLIMSSNKFTSDEFAMNIYNSKRFEFAPEGLESFMDLSGNGISIPLPTFCDGTATQQNRGQPCVFRDEVLDECYKSRFWALALEFYLLKGNRQPVYRCLMANCPEQDFKTAEKMLTHLKHCNLFPKGEFFCPVCNQIESFRTVSKKRCSWYRTNLGRRFLEKTKSVFREMAGSRPGLLCVKCKSARVYPSYAQGVSCPSGSYDGDWPKPVNDAKELQCMPVSIELDSDDGPSKNSMMRHQETFQERPFKPQQAPSELSPDSARGHGKSATVSPASDSQPPESQALGIDFQPPLLSRAHRRMDGVHSEYRVRPHNETYSDPFGNRNYNSFMEADLSSYGASTISSFFPEYSATLDTEPVSVVRQTSRRKATPSLTVNTSEVGLQHAQWGALLLDGDQTLDTSMIDPSMFMSDLSVEQLPPRIIKSPPGTSPASCPFPSSDTILSNESRFFQSSPSKSLSSSNTEQSPHSLSSATELKCQECGFVPKGKPENLRAYFRKHLAVHDNSPKPCTVAHCDKTFTRQDNLTSHLSKVHGIVRPKRRYDSDESLRSPGQSRKKSIRVAESFELE
ncbi:hypothetical protein F5Y18DRAFT_50433 [Xylariaceae sp. FL1019]|nr:hypothetical protein F5Y18DRAFT_50433 [Xylariaceae sp. FL1019]